MKTFAQLILGILALNMLAAPNAADRIGLAKDAPVAVKSTNGKDKNGKPLSPTKVSGKLAEDGGFGMDLKNEGGETAKDVHIKVIKPADAVITTVEWAGTPAPFTTVTALPAAEVDSHGTLSNGGVVGVDLLVRKSGAPPTTYPEGTAVEFEIWWTRGVNHNIIVSATSPDTIGSSDPMITLASLGIPGFNVAPAEIPEGQAQGDLNMIVLAECHGFRFQKGSLVLSTDGNQGFAMGHLDGEELVVAAYDETGRAVTSQTRVSFSSPRIDVNGNFVVDIERNQSDDLHIVIVIKNLRLTRANEREKNGRPIKVSFSGAAIGGGCIKDNYTIATIVGE